MSQQFAPIRPAGGQHDVRRIALADRAATTPSGVSARKTSAHHAGQE